MNFQAADKYFMVTGSVDYTLGIDNAQRKIYKDALGSDDITDDYAGTLYYDDTGQKWVMNGLNFRTSAITAIQFNNASGAGVRLDITGDNNIRVVGQGFITAVGRNVIDGTNPDRITVSGTGTLNLYFATYADIAADVANNTKGIIAKELTIDSGTININTDSYITRAIGVYLIGASQQLELKAGSLNADINGTQRAYCIYALSGSVSISGGTHEIATAASNGTAMMVNATTADFTGDYSDPKDSCVKVSNSAANAALNNGDLLSLSSKHYLSIGPKGRITVSPASLDFGTVVYGISAPITVTVTCTGFPVTLIDPEDTTIFECGSLSDTSLNVGESATFTVQHKSSLEAGNFYSDGIIITGTNGETVSVPASCTVRAPYKYAMTYDANGGTGSAMSPDTAMEGSPFTLPSCDFTAPAGKHFKEWAIGSTGGTRVAASSAHTFTADTTVYAVWEDLPAVSAPTFNPAGGTFTSAQSVTISCATAGAEIRYTTDGSEPTGASQLYFVPISVTETMTIKAKAFKKGYTASVADSAVYTISDGSGSPKMGDASQTALWGCVALLACATLAGFALRRKRRNG